MPGGRADAPRSFLSGLRASLSGGALPLRAARPPVFWPGSGKRLAALPPCPLPLAVPGPSSLSPPGRPPLLLSPSRRPPLGSNGKGRMGPLGSCQGCSLSHGLPVLPQTSRWAWLPPSHLHFLIQLGLQSEARRQREEGVTGQDEACSRKACR